MRPEDFPEYPLPTPSSQAEDGRAGVVFEIDAAGTAPPGTGRPEPVLAGVPTPGEFDETARLDPNRATPEREPPAARRQRGISLAVLGSLGVHLLPLLMLLEWTSTPAEIAAPIPVQLVIEAPPPPPPPPAPKAEEFKRPPPGRLASEDIGEKASPPPEAAAAAPPPPDVAAAAPPAPESPAAAPPAPREPAPGQSAPSQPAPTQMAAALPPPPKPIRPPKPAVPAFTWQRLDIVPQDGPRAPRAPGPAASRDEYLAYCMSLIRGHFGGLSSGFLHGRRGTTLLRIMVREDGTIARITPEQPSRYPEIDARIAEAVYAVHRFPPLPQWLQGPSAGLILQVVYPDGL